MHKLTDLCPWVRFTRAVASNALTQIHTAKTPSDKEHGIALCLVVAKLIRQVIIPMCRESRHPGFAVEYERLAGLLADTALPGGKYDAANFPDRRDTVLLLQDQLTELSLKIDRAVCRRHCKSRPEWEKPESPWVNEGRAA